MRKVMRTTQLSEKERYTLLEKLGVSTPEEKTGIIPKRKEGEKKILFYESYDTTPFRYKVRKVRSVGRGPIIPCLGTLRKRCKIQKKIIAPVISPRMIPSHLTNIVAHVTGLYIEGDVVYDFDHYEGEEGKICEKRSYEEEWSCEKASGSADLFDNISIFTGSVEQIENVIDHIISETDLLRIKQLIKIRAHWISSTIWDINFYFMLLDLFVGGDFTVHGDIDLTFNYRDPSDRIFTGKRLFQFNMTLPIEGDITYTT